MSWLLYCNIELNISNSPSTVEMYLFIETYNCFLVFNYLKIQIIMFIVYV